jgi:hypothetical protein
MKQTAIGAAIALLLLSSFAACTKSGKPLVSPVAASAQADPHAGVGTAAVPAGVGHKGRVVDVLAAGQYSYIQVDEQGKKLWVATVSAKVEKGDEIEFADSPPFANFQSKVLNRSFDSVIFADGIRNNGKK